MRRRGRGAATRGLLSERSRQLDAKGLMVRTGTPIDASPVAADCRRPRKGASVAARNGRAAGWNTMPRQPLFGYKMPRALDQNSGRVRRVMPTPGQVSDKAPFLHLVQGDETAVYADKGHDVAGIFSGWPSRASRPA